MGINGMLVLSGVDLVDVIHKELQRDMSILIKDGKIAEIGKRGTVRIPVDAKVLKLPGKTVIPGLIDSHLHMTQSGVDDYMKPFAEKMTVKLQRNAYLNLKSGITSVRNMPGGGGDCVLNFRDRVEKGEVIGPRILTCGPALSPSYGYFSLKMFIPLNKVMRTVISRVMGAYGLSVDVDTVHEAEITVHRLKEKGVNFIKSVSPGKNFSYIDRDPKFREEALKLGIKPRLLDANMKPEILEAIAKSAHKEGLKLSVHNICWPEGFIKAVMAGADSMEHVPHGLIDDETFKKMKENNVFWIPTIYPYYNWKNLMDHPEEYDSPEIKERIPETLHALGKKTLSKVREGIRNGTDPFWTRFYNEMDHMKEEYVPDNLKRAMEHGIKLAAGVDAGAAGAGYVPHGILYKELELFVQYGMDEFDAIRTATVNAAELIGMKEQLGSIEAGKIADLVVLDGNPIEDISDLGKIHCVIKDGIEVYSNK